jgi:hypothetical protein
MFTYSSEETVSFLLFYTEAFLIMSVQNLSSQIIYNSKNSFSKRYLVCRKVFVKAKDISTELEDVLNFWA